MQNILNEKPSVNGNFWSLKPINQGLYSDLMAQFELSEFVATTLARRDDINLENFNNFLDPKIKNLMPSPFVLQDMEKAVARILKAIEQKQKIVLFSDYDVDGACSAAVMYHFLKACNTEAKVYIPDRISEGYGPNTKALTQLREEGYELVITLDCGTVAFDPLSNAASQGLESIVIDHHFGTKELPKSIAIINPNRVDDKSGLQYLCGAGVAWFFCVAISSKMPNHEELKKHIMSLLDLVALATVCDVVPLIGINRAFVRQGIKIIEERGRVGIRAMLETAQISEKITVSHLGFLLGPMINAGGRIGKSTMAANLLCSNNYQSAILLAAELYELNQQRKEIEQEMVKGAVEMIESQNLDTESPIFVYSKEWHQGIIGIVASRIKDRYYLPTIIGSLVEDCETKQQVIKASCRSIVGINIGAIITEAVQQNILLKGGGHAMAGGFTILLSRADDFRNFIKQKTLEILAECRKFKILTIDKCLAAEAVNAKLLQELDQLQPFGAGHTNPVFVLKNLTIIGNKILKESHIRTSFRCKYSGLKIDAISFRSVDTKLGDALLQNIGKNVGLACNIEGKMFRDMPQASVNIIDITIE